MIFLTVENAKIKIDHILIIGGRRFKMKRYKTDNQVSIAIDVNIKRALNHDGKDIFKT